MNPPRYDMTERFCSFVIAEMMSFLLFVFLSLCEPPIYYPFEGLIYIPGLHHIALYY